MFKIKRVYKLELQTHEAMKLFGSTKKINRQSKSDLVKHELRVTSCELRVENSKARIEIQQCELKSTSYEVKSTSLNSRVYIHD